MDIYLDTCALNRLSDPIANPRIQSESEAVLRLLDQVALGNVRWLASSILRLELERNPNITRRLNALALLQTASEFILPSAATLLRARHLDASGYRSLDSLHLALSEQAGVDFLITTDDRFLRLGQRNAGAPAVAIINPVDLVQRRFPWLLQKP